MWRKREPVKKQRSTSASSGVSEVFDRPDRPLACQRGAVLLPTNSAHSCQAALCVKCICCTGKSKGLSSAVLLVQLRPALPSVAVESWSPARPPTCGLVAPHLPGQAGWPDPCHCPSAAAELCSSCQTLQWLWLLHKPLTPGIATGLASIWEEIWAVYYHCPLQLFPDHDSLPADQERPRALPPRYSKKGLEKKDLAIFRTSCLPGRSPLVFVGLSDFQMVSWLSYWQDCQR